MDRRAGRAARLAALRQDIALAGAGASFARVSLGAACSLDRMLRGGLARGALHEIAPGRAGDGAAACGFALALAARLAGAAPPGRAAIFWIIEDFAAREGGAPYGPGLALHGIDPAGLTFVHAATARESLWAMEEALKCHAVAAVIGEVWTLGKVYGLTASRRLALAAQASGAAALLLAPGLIAASAEICSCAQTRFAVSARRRTPGEPARAGPPPTLPGLPLPAPPLWSVRLVKARGGAGRSSAALVWDPEEACLADAFPLRLVADARDRPGLPADAPARGRQTA